jgi:four helix bundle protein
MDQGKNDIKQRTYTFSLDIIKLIRFLPNDMVSRTIGGQLLRSATSIGANIVEAQAGSSKKDFINYLNIALKSANESVYWLNLLRDSGIGKGESINVLVEDGTQLAKILGSSLVTLKKQEQHTNGHQ